MRKLQIEDAEVMRIAIPLSKNSAESPMLVERRIFVEPLYPVLERGESVHALQRQILHPAGAREAWPTH